MTHADMFSAKQWRQWVERGRTLVRTTSSVQFELGDLTLEMVSRRPRDGQDYGVEKVLAAFGHEIGLSDSTLSNYRYVALAWPPERRNADVSFAIHEALAAHPSRFRKINNPPVDPITGQRRWTVNEALRAAGRTPHHPVTAQERVNKVRDLITDDEDAAVVVREVLNRPTVVRKVMDDSSSRHILRHAERTQSHDTSDDDRHYREQGEASIEQTSPEPTAPRTGSRGVHYSEAPREVLELLGVCTTFYTQMQRLIPSLHVAEYDDNTKHTLLESLERVRAAAGWAETVINTGDTTMDEALAQLLRDES